MLLNVVLPPQVVGGQSSFLFGFRGGPESDDECSARVGETRYFRVASIQGCPIADEEKLRKLKLTVVPCNDAPQGLVSQSGVMGWRDPFWRKKISPGQGQLPDSCRTRTRGREIRQPRGGSPALALQSQNPALMSLCHLSLQVLVTIVLCPGFCRPHIISILPLQIRG